MTVPERREVRRLLNQVMRGHDGDGIAFPVSHRPFVYWWWISYARNFTHKHQTKIVNCLFWKITPVSDKTCFVAVRWPSRTVSIFSVMADSARQHSSGLIMEKFMTHQELKVMLLKDPAFRAAYEAESQNPQSGYQIIRHHGDGTEEVVFDSRVSGTDLPTNWMNRPDWWGQAVHLLLTDIWFWFVWRNGWFWITVDSRQLTASVNDSRQILPSLPLVRIMYIMLNWLWRSFTSPFTSTHR